MGILTESTEYQNIKNSIMSVSLEALAMAGTDYFSIAIDVEEWKRRDLELCPPHLLAEEEEGSRSIMERN